MLKGGLQNAMGVNETETLPILERFGVCPTTIAQLYLIFIPTHEITTLHAAPELPLAADKASDLTAITPPPPLRCSCRYSYFPGPHSGTPAFRLSLAGASAWSTSSSPFYWISLLVRDLDKRTSADQHQRFLFPYSERLLGAFVPTCSTSSRPSYWISALGLVSCAYMVFPGSLCLEPLVLGRCLDEKTTAS